MINILDIIGIVVVLFSTIIAFKKGFVKTFFSFASTFVALILAFSLCNIGVKILKENTKIDEWLTETLTTSLNQNNNEQAIDVETKKDVDDQNSNEFTKGLESLPEDLKNMLNMEEYKENAKNAIIQNSIEIILKILSWVIIYVVARIILMIICIVFNGIMSIPFLKQINNLAGLGVGFILGIFRIYLILAFVSFVASVVSIDSVMNLIRSSMILSVMYENNILLSLIF